MPPRQLVSTAPRRGRRFAVHALPALALAMSALFAAPLARAQPLGSVDEARALFKEAVSDEDDYHRYEEALAKFRRVQAFKDSVNVRYRIGTCLEELGQLAAALGAFEGALKLGGDDAGSDVFKASQEHASAVEKRVAKVKILLSAHAPADAEVRVDDQAVPAQDLQQPIALDAGHHTFAGSATGVPPFRTSLTLGEGSQVSITIALDPPAPTKPPLGPPPGHGGRATLPTTRSSTHTAGWITIGIGGAVLAGGGVLAIFQRAAVEDLRSSCPSGTCPASRESDLSSERSRALLFEPLSIGLAAAGVVAAGVGLYLVLKPDVVVAPTAGGLMLRGTF